MGLLFGVSLGDKGPNPDQSYGAPQQSYGAPQQQVKIILNFFNFKIFVDNNKAVII